MCVSVYLCIYTKQNKKFKFTIDDNILLLYNYMCEYR